MSPILWGIGTLIFGCFVIGAFLLGRMSAFDDERR
jgi:hypothetical protein